MVTKGHIVFISEYNAPEDFECIWSTKIVSSLTRDTGSKIGIEKLLNIGINKSIIYFFGINRV